MNVDSRPLYCLQVVHFHLRDTLICVSAEDNLKLSCLSEPAEGNRGENGTNCVTHQILTILAFAQQILAVFGAFRGFPPCAHTDLKP